MTLGSGVRNQVSIAIAEHVMDTANIDQLIAHVLRKHPHPPRTVDTSRLRSALLRNQSTKALVYAVVSVLGGVFAWSQSDAVLSIAGIFAVSGWLSGIFFLWLVIAPLRRWRYALVHGVIGIAEVVTVRYVPNQSKRISLQPYQYGVARGTWKVSAQSNKQIETFSLDDRWAKQLTTGTRVRILLHPQTGKVLVPIGPEIPQSKPT
jgi:hypothetical protein